MRDCARLLNGASFEFTEQRGVATALFHLSIEHHSAIHLLLDNEVVGSALALYRPQFECYVRGAWYAHCATADDALAFTKGAEPPSVNAMLKGLEKHAAFEEGTLRFYKESSWRSLCDFTHGGRKQFHGRVRGSEIIANYKQDGLAGLLLSSMTVGLLAAIGVCTVCEDIERAQALRNAYRASFQAA